MVDWLRPQGVWVEKFTSVKIQPAFLSSIAKLVCRYFMESHDPRNSPLFSRLGIGIAVVFLVGFGIVFWLRGGANFNPGPVTAMAQSGVSYGGFISHAAFENQCSLCHDPLQRDNRAGMRGK